MGISIETQLGQMETPQNVGGTSFYSVSPEILHSSKNVFFKGKFVVIENSAVAEEAGIQNDQRIYVSNELKRENLILALIYLSKILSMPPKNENSYKDRVKTIVEENLKIKTSECAELLREEVIFQLEKPDDTNEQKIALRILLAYLQTL